MLVIQRRKHHPGPEAVAEPTVKMTPDAVSAPDVDVPNPASRAVSISTRPVRQRIPLEAGASEAKDTSPPQMTDDSSGDLSKSPLAGSQPPAMPHKSNSHLLRTAIPSSGRPTPTEVCQRKRFDAVRPPLSKTWWCGALLLTAVPAARSCRMAKPNRTGAESSTLGWVMLQGT